MVIPSQLLVCAAVLELLFLLLLSVPNNSDGVVPAIELQILTHLVYLVCVYTVLRGARIDKRLILGAAFLFRLTMWIAYPALSDDVYRYRWEGQVQTAGGNPYQVRPADSPIRDVTFPNVGSKEFKAGYGPLIELQERLVYEVASRCTRDPFVQVFWYKLPAAVYELLTLGCLLALLRIHRMPDSRLLFYAWCPTPIVEFWWNGHNDSLPLLLICVALLLAAGKRWSAAFVALSFAVAAKIWPILLFPAFILWGKRDAPRCWHWTLLLPVMLLCAMPYWSDTRENAQFMTGFVGGWRNNDSLFGGLLWLAQGNLYMAKYMAITILGVCALACALLPWSLEEACMGILTGTLLISANVHPWYMTWLTLYLPFAPWSPVLLWAALQPIGYMVLLAWKVSGQWIGNSGWRWWIYLPVFVWTAVKWYLGWRRSEDVGVV